MFYVYYESLDYGMSLLAQFENREEAEKYCNKAYKELYDTSVESVWVSSVEEDE